MHYLVMRTSLVQLLFAFIGLAPFSRANETSAPPRNCSSYIRELRPLKNLTKYDHVEHRLFSDPDGNVVFYKRFFSNNSIGFQNERSALEKLRDFPHPNIPRLICSEDDAEKGESSILTTCLSSRMVDLYDALDKEMFPRALGDAEKESMLALIQMDRALKHLHNHGIYLNHIAPENLYYDEHGRLMVMNFESARDLNQSSRGFLFRHKGYWSPLMADPNFEKSEEINRAKQLSANSANDFFGFIALVAVFSEYVSQGKFRIGPLDYKNIRWINNDELSYTIIIKFGMNNGNALGDWLAKFLKNLPNLYLDRNTDDFRPRLFLDDPALNVVVDQLNRIDKVYDPSSVCTEYRHKLEFFKSLGSSGGVREFNLFTDPFDNVVFFKRIIFSSGKSYLRENFEKEVMVLEKLRNFTHPNIPTLLCSEIGEKEGIMLTTSLSKNVVSLEYALRKKVFPKSYRSVELESKMILIQLDQTLKFLHDLKIYHNDIKPLNIIYDDTGRIMVIDFDAARDFDRESIDDARYTDGYIGPLLNAYLKSQDSLTDDSKMFLKKSVIGHSTNDFYAFAGLIAILNKYSKNQYYESQQPLVYGEYKWIGTNQNLPPKDRFKNLGFVLEIKSDYGTGSDLESWLKEILKINIVSLDANYEIQPRLFLDDPKLNREVAKITKPMEKIRKMCLEYKFNQDLLPVLNGILAF